MTKKYELSVITFFDILGFKKLVESSDEESIYNILEVFKRKSKPDEEIAKMYSQKLINFSDSCIRVTNMYSQANITYPNGILFHEILDLVYIQHDLIRSNILIRGSLTIGQIYAEDSVVFGPGFIEAHELEKKHSIFPRIIIDPIIFALLEEPEAYRILGTVHHSIAEEKKEIQGLLRKLDDDEWFIDYLKVMCSEYCVFDFDPAYVSFLEKHKKLILDNYAHARNDENVQRKCKWLVHYHNDTIKHLKDFLLQFKVDVDELLIGEQENL